MNKLVRTSKIQGRCPLLEQLPPEIRSQIWEDVAEETVRSGCSWSSYGSFPTMKRTSNGGRPSSTDHRGILSTNRQIFREVGPLFYDKVCVVVAHPNQTLRWLQKISPRNSACIRHLVIKYHSLLLDYNEPKHLQDRMPAWAAALRCMPNLLSLTFDFYQEPDTPTKKAFPDEYISANETVILNELAKSALAWSKLMDPSGKKSTLDFQYRPQRAPPGPDHGHQQQFNRAVIAIDEIVPSPLQRFFAKLMDIDTTSLDLPVTGLPSEFFLEQGYELMSTYAFNEEKAEQVSIVLAYQKLPRRPIKVTTEDLKFIMSGLPLKYLRLGCRHIDSQNLRPIPTLADELVTLDLAFTDPDPGQVVLYLQHVRLRCPALYTVAIAVSPLHDRDPTDPKPEKFFSRKSVSAEVAVRWKPFWDKVDELNANGVKVWEGEVCYHLLEGRQLGLVPYGSLFSVLGPAIKASHWVILAC